jgi:HK97 family phage prohead protease
MSSPSERRVFATEIRSREGRFVEGIAAPYDSETPIGSQYVEVLARGLFNKSIREAALNLPLHVFHDTSTYPVGRAVEWDDRPDGLYGVWEMDSSDEAKRAVEAAESRMVGGLSVGFSPIQSDVKPGDETTPTRVIRKEARLVEVSMVSTPAYAGAVITLVRTAGPRTPRPHFDKWKKWADRLKEESI